jgi:adenine-specific DNA-methyltransferase
MFNNSLTQKFLEEASLDNRKELGQFFTPKRISDIVFNNIEIVSSSKVLEPSFGSGEFLKIILEKTKNVVGVELDKDLFQHKPQEGSYFNNDFLTLNLVDKFDFVVGNPPYFETKKYKELFKDVSCGRPNIFSFFIKKSIDLLKDDGILAFVIPTSLNTGKYFSKIRKYIVSTCNIVKLINVGNFEGANIETQILILQKTNKKKNKNYIVFKENNNVIFSEQFQKLNALIKNRTTLKELGFSVVTGNIVWNQHKEKLTNNKSTLLIWNKNIKNKQLNLCIEGKKQYILDTEPKYQKGIVFKRIGLDFAFCNEPFIAENHVNVIVNKENKLSDEQLFEKLKELDTKHFSLFSDNTQLSAKELEEMPLWENTKEIGRI